MFGSCFRKQSFLFQILKIYKILKKLKGLYLLILLHLSALMNRLALSDLLMKSCSKFQSEISTHLDNVHGTISLEFSVGHSKKCTNTVSIQIAVKNLLVCPGLPVESEEVCVHVWQLNVDGCIWIGRGGRERA